MQVETLNEALIECVKACGGSKQVGPALWPEKAPDAAQRTLLDALNNDRPAKLSPEQAMLIFRLARAKGCHIGMQFMAADLGYTMPTPVEPKDEMAELQRQFIEAQKSMQDMLTRMERVQRMGAQQ